MPFELKEKVAVVSGGASGIGRSIAEVFAAQGAQVVVVDRDAAAGHEVAEKISAAGARASFIACDVALPAEVERAFDRVVGAHGRLDILVNSAGVSHIGNVENTSESELDRIYAVNVKGTYNCLKQGVEKMGRGGGAIVNLASIAGIAGLKERFAYSMSKGAVVAMTLSVAADYVDHGIRCNCICPARIHTPFVDGFLARNYPGREREVFEQLASAQPIGRMGTPEEVAHLALFLCSDEAAFVTGSAYTIDGGATSLI